MDAHLFRLTGGQVADCTAADTLLDQMPRTRILHGGKGYGSNAVRRKIEEKGTALNIPPKVNRCRKNCAIKRMFCRFKDFPRVATRYERIATNVMAAVCLAAPPFTGYKA